MSYTKNLFLLLLVALVTFSACERTPFYTDNIDYSESRSADDYLSEGDAKWNPDGATRITFNGSVATIQGNGARVSGDSLVIDSYGEYYFSGTQERGAIHIRAGSNEIVKLIFDNLSLTSTTGSALYVERAGRVVIILPDGSSNTLTESVPAIDTVNHAAIYSRSDLVFHGSGSLSVTANTGDGIEGRDGVVIHSGNLRVTANGHGIIGREFLVLLGGTHEVTSGRDGVRSDGNDPGDGYIDIFDGDLTVAANGDGAQASAALYIDGGRLNFFALADGIKVPDGMADEVAFSMNGGLLILRSGADGIDAAGKVNLEGGFLLIHTEGSASDLPVVSTSGLHLMGGTYCAIGRGAELWPQGALTDHPAILFDLGSELLPGTLLHLEEASGEEVATVMPYFFTRYTLIFSEKLSAGSSYTLFSGGTSSSENFGGYFPEGTYTPGTAYTSFTINSGFQQITPVSK